MNWIFERNHLEDDFEDEIIDRIFGYKLPYVGKEIWS